MRKIYRPLLVSIVKPLACIYAVGLCVTAPGCKSPPANNDAGTNTTGAGSSSATGTPAPGKGSARSVADQAKQDSMNP